MLHDYTLAPTVDSSLFWKQWEFLKENGFRQTNKLIDVDGSLICIHRNDIGDEIKLFLDCEVGAVYIQSSYRIDEFLVTKPIVVSTT